MKARRKTRYSSFGLPDKSELISIYSSFLDNISNIVCEGSATTPGFHNWFYRHLHAKVSGQTRTCNADDYFNLRKLITDNRNISKEDIYQQAFLCLINYWDFYTNNLNKIRKTVFLYRFQDIVRLNLIKDIAEWVAHQLLLSDADLKGPVFSQIEYPPEICYENINLGWTMIKSTIGPFKDLTTLQKYLLYLRYIKEVSIKDICKLTNSHKTVVYQHFADIRSLLNKKT